MTIESVALINPRAGRRAVEADAVSDALERYGVRHAVEVVSGSADMRTAAVEVVRSGKRLVLVGGDGTVGLAMDALVRAGVAATAEPVGILPAGTGCDLLRTFGIPQDLVEAAAHLVRPGTYRIDLGRIQGEWGDRIFANVAQAGIGAAAAQTAQRLGRRLGAARYPVAFASRFLRFSACEVEIESDRTLRSRALAVIMANGQFFAGGWNVAPKAMLVDGEIDVQIIDAVKWQAPTLVPRIVAGAHLRHRAVTRRSLASFTVRTDAPWPVEADGDPLGSTPAAVDVIPSAVSIKI